jgi:redox-sensitive bicupin YhaK (pirin superfamily)
MRKRRSVLLLAMLLSTSGCFLFHKESPQQQYTEALMRGNSMQASQVWLKMSPEDRMKFARGEGIKPDEQSTQKDVQQMLTNHANESGEGPSNAEQMEEQMPTPLGASLKQLPGVESSSPTN